MIVSYAIIQWKELQKIPSLNGPLSQGCWNLLHLHIPNQASILEILEFLKGRLQTPIFMSIILLLRWTFCTTRNDLIFEGTTANFGRMPFKFQERTRLASTWSTEQTQATPFFLVEHKQQLEEWRTLFCIDCVLFLVFFVSFVS